jgi:hypothetical protein
LLVVLGVAAADPELVKEKKETEESGGKEG